MTLHSFKELGSAFNIQTPETKVEKPRKCRVCGGEMTRIQGTNVWACHGSIKQENEDGTIIVVSPCTNTSMSKAK